MASRNYSFSLNGHISRTLVDELILEHGYEGSVVYEYSPQLGTDITLTGGKNDLEVEETFTELLKRAGAEFRI